jgi:hypothetical protein
MSRLNYHSLCRTRELELVLHGTGDIKQPNLIAVVIQSHRHSNTLDYLGLAGGNTSGSCGI